MTDARLAAWLAAALDPLDGATAASGGSDFDLNPGHRRTERSNLSLAAVLVGVVPRASGTSVILTRRADTLANHTGQIAFPGGRLDPGETVVAAAVREAWEEIALDPRQVRPVGLSDPYETVTGFNVTPVVALVSPDAAWTAAPAEVAEVFEVPLAALVDPGLLVEDRFIAPDGSERRFYVLPWEGRRIWGATAGMIRALARRLAAVEVPA